MQKKKLLSILFSAIVVVEIVIILLLQFQLNDLQKDNQSKISSLEALESRISDLEYELSLSDEEYYKKAAKEAGYYDPNEIIYNTDLAD